jgi:hypothetical protein
MSKANKGKKDLALRLYEMYEDEVRLTHEYLTECLNEIKPRYLSSVKTATEENCIDFLDDESDHVKLWSFLDGINSNKEIDTQKKNKVALEKLLVNNKTEGTTTELLQALDEPELLAKFHPYIMIYFSLRVCNINVLNEHFGHAVGYVKFVGDDTVHWFESPGNEMVDAKIIASVSVDTEDSHGDAEGYLRIMTENHEQIIYELDEFRMLTHINNTKESKVALFTVFSKKLRLLFADTVSGCPGLDSAEIRPITVLNNSLVPYQSLRFFNLSEKAN